MSDRPQPATAGQDGWTPGHEHTFPEGTLIEVTDEGSDHIEVHWSGGPGRVVFVKGRRGGPLHAHDLVRPATPPITQTQEFRVLVEDVERYQRRAEVASRSRRAARALRFVATGQVQHTAAGHCPDAVNGYDQRAAAGTCPACDALRHADNMIGV